MCKQLKIAATSDIHGKLPEVDECDILVVCGDISPVNNDHSEAEQKRWFFEKFVPALEACKAKAVVFIPGNHDRFIYNLHRKDDDFRFMEKNLPKNCHYLCDSLVEIEGVKIYGTPWVKRPMWGRIDSPVWSFSFGKSKDLLAKFNKIPDGVDILISHSPPYGYCDVVAGLEDEGHIGSIELTEAIKRKAPAYSFFGHIHSGRHIVTEIPSDAFPQTEGTLARNVSFLGESYKPEFPVFYFIFDVPERK